MVARALAMVLVALPVVLTAQKPVTPDLDTISEVFAETRVLMRKTMGVTFAKPKVNIRPGTSAREAIIAQFFALYSELEPQFESLPALVPVDRRISKSGLRPETVAQLQRLLSRQMLPPSGPLTFNGEPTEAELGRTIGYFLIAVADARHVADREFSPIYSR